MKIQRIPTLFLLVFVARAYAGESASLDRFVYRFDFESGSVGAWSSYPPAQDTAYDPTIWVKKIPGNPGLSLVRQISPNYPVEYVFGVRKKLNILIDQDSRLTFRFLVKNPRKTKEIIVKLATEEGKSGEVRIPVAESEVWRSADISLAEMASPAGPRRLEAVALMAVCPQADPESRLWFAVDDVQLTGWRPRLAKIAQPPLHWLEEWSTNISGKHYDEGESLELRGDLPENVTQAFARVTDFFNENRSFRQPLEVKDRSFWGRIPGARMRAGLWQAEIRTQSGKKEGFPTPFIFLVCSKKQMPGHPSILLTPKEKSRLTPLIQEGRGRRTWERILESARNYRAKYNPSDFTYNLDAYDEVFWLPTYGGYANTIRTLSGFARTNALVFGMNGDPSAGEAARRALLQMADWPSYVHPHILNQGQFTYWPVGLVLIDLAVAYDLVYGILSPAERQKISSALYHKGITEVFKEYVRDNRVSSNTSNWISHVTGGGILSALAVSGEFSDEELEPYLTGMILKVSELVRSTFDRDGDYGEGYAYHNFTMQTLAEIMPALENHFGIVFPVKVNQSHLYLPYQINSQTKEVYDFGDTGTKLLPLSNFAAVLFRTRDPLLKWLENLAPGESEADLLFGDDSIRPESPAGRLSPVRLFRDVGTAVFRSGFAPDDFCFVFRAGPFYNHQHFDQGSFFLADRGEDFLTEGGRTDYYSDPWYQGFFIQPGAHNCILVDDNVESQRAGDLLDDVKAWQDYARITDFLDFDDGAFLSAELAPIYQGKFQTLRRSLLYLKPRTIVLIDTGEGAREADRLNLRFHAPLKEDIWLAGNTAVIKRKSRELCLRTLQPGDVIAEIRKRPLSLYEFGAENPITMKARGFLQLSAGIEGGLVQFINLMGTDSSLVSGAGLADRGPYFELQAGGRRYLVKKPGSARFEADGWVIAADLFSQKDGGIRALRVTEIQEDSRPIFRSDSPVSLAMEKQKKSLTFSTWARRKSRVEIVSPSKPRAVERNGRLFQSWSWAKGAVLLEIPEEASTSRIVY